MAHEEGKEPHELRSIIAKLLETVITVTELQQNREKYGDEEWQAKMLQYAYL